MRFVMFAAISALLVTAGSSSACELRLLLTWDVSPSMTPEEHYLQRHGTALAFLDPNVQNAISIMPSGVFVSIMQWAGPDEQVVSLPWTALQNGRDVEALALKVEALSDPFDSFTGTAVGDSLRAAAAHLATGPQDCGRTVLDISGDGAANIGIPAGPEADALIGSGVTINALVLPSSHKWAGDNDPFLFYVNEVATGSGSFVIDVASYEDYWRALRMKLLRELTPYVARNR